MQKAGDRILGTLLGCAWLTVALSFMPPKLLRRIFPPLVTGWVLVQNNLDLMLHMEHRRHCSGVPL